MLGTHKASRPTPTRFLVWRGLASILVLGLHSLRASIRGGWTRRCCYGCNMSQYRELFEAAGVKREQFLLDLLASKPKLFQRLRKNHAIDPTILQKQ